MSNGPSHAFIVPLIGGQAIGQAEAFGSRPRYMMSYEAFADNDQHIRAWWPEVPFDVIDAADRSPMSERVDVVGSTCPCAGLSALSPVSRADSAINDWLYRATEHVLESVRPEVFWGENAPALSSEKGRPVALHLREIGRRHGYTFSMYRTKSELHGLCQTRQRTFFYFWRRDDGKVPILPWVRRPRFTVEDFFREDRPRDKLSEVYFRDLRPSDLPIYRRVLDKLGTDHVGFMREQVQRTTSLTSYMWENDLTDDLLAWFEEHGPVRDAERLRRWKRKFDMNTDVMERYVIFPKGIIGAFVKHEIYGLSHPFEDRFLTIREMLDMMGMPVDFTFDRPKRNILHIAQNVPVKTATDAALFIRSYLDDELPLIETGDELVVYDNMMQRLIGAQTVRYRKLF